MGIRVWPRQQGDSHSEHTHATWLCARTKHFQNLVRCNPPASTHCGCPPGLADAGMS